MPLPLAVPIIISALSLAAKAIPTADERAANKEMERLEGLKKLGKLGLTSDEREAYESALMDPLRAQTRETQLRQAGERAAYGQAAGGNLLAGQVAAQDVDARAAQRAGGVIQQADVTRRAEQEAKIDGLIADKGAKQKALVDEGVETIGALGAAYGAQKGGEMSFTSEKAPAIYDALLQSGFSESEADAIVSDMASEAGRAELEQYLAGRQ